MANNPSEHDEQVALFTWAAYDKRPELKMLFAVPNGGLRNKAVAGKLKAEGVKAGVEDVFLDVARGGYHGLRIEMKVGKKKPTPKQKDWMARHNTEGYLATVCYDWIEARGAIENYLVPAVLQFPKDRIYRSEAYKAYVKSLPCIICGGNSDPHHEIGGGKALKGPDLFCIPLCREHHDERGAGVETFWKKHNMDRWQVISETLAGYVERMENSLE